MPRTVLVDRHGADEAAGRPVARERVRDGLADKSQALVLGHARPVVLVHPRVEEDGAATTHRVVVLDHGSAEGDVVDGAAVDGIVAADDDAGLDLEAVRVAHLAEDGGDGLDGDGALLVGVEGVLAHVARNNLGEGLRVRGGAGAAAVDVVEELGELVGHAVDDVRAGGGARVSGKDDASVVRDGDDGGAEVVAAFLAVGVAELGVLDGVRYGEIILGSVESAERVLGRRMVLEVLGLLNQSRSWTTKHSFFFLFFYREETETRYFFFLKLLFSWSCTVGKGEMPL